ncbi:MAG: hypothetical protein FWD31_06510 [Planctomycetaceae bacterium]|nr:hypothetical protein [Planctomycetaceae bacterium]
MIRRKRRGIDLVAVHEYNSILFSVTDALSKFGNCAGGMGVYTGDTGVLRRKHGRLRRKHRHSSHNDANPSFMTPDYE